MHLDYYITAIANMKFWMKYGFPLFLQENVFFEIMSVVGRLGFCCMEVWYWTDYQPLAEPMVTMIIHTILIQQH